MPINQVMKELENIGRYDIRIAGRSNLEAPTWNDLSVSPSPKRFRSKLKPEPPRNSISLRICNL